MKVHIMLQQVFLDKCEFMNICNDDKSMNFSVVITDTCMEMLLIAVDCGLCLLTVITDTFLNVHVL